MSQQPFSSDNGFSTTGNVSTGNLTLTHGGLISEVASPVAGNYAIALSALGTVSGDQQLLVYPTMIEANHLHLTSGNLYNTELFLGNDDLYVKLANTGNVVVNSNDSVGNIAQWTFGTDANLHTPQGGYIGPAGVKGDGTMLTGGLGNIASLTSYYADAPGIYSSCVTVNADGTLNITTYGNGTGVAGQWTFTSKDLNVPGDSIISTANAVSGLGGSNINIKAGASDPDNFNSNPGGNLNLFGGYGSNGDGGGGPGGEVNITSGASYDSHAGNVNINAGTNSWTYDYTGNLTANGNLNLVTNSNLWSFDTNGALTLPGNTLQIGLISGNTGLNSINSANITINASGNAWTFGANGNLTAPGNLALAGGQIQSGVTTVVNDGINSIITGTTTQMDVFAFPFTTTTRGLLTISGDIDPTQALGTWYYQSINTNTFEIFTDSTYSTPVDSTGWAAYGGGGTVAIQENLPTGNLVLNSNGFLTTFATNGNVVFSGVLNGNGAGLTNILGSANTIAIGLQSGSTSQGINSVAIGINSGGVQGAEAVAVGDSAGEGYQGNNAVAIGSYAGFTDQGIGAVAIGSNAGFNLQGVNAIAIGQLAGNNSQANNSIILNASGAALDSSTAGLFVNPVRDGGSAAALVTAGFYGVYYNPTTGEFVYASSP